jgi:hypothetical protein
MAGMPEIGRNGLRFTSAISFEPIASDRRKTMRTQN